jgi:DNA-binding IclR family transcriptional regulator
LQVLRLLAAAPGPLPATTVAGQLGAPRASTYRLLRSMVDEGFVVHFPEEGRWGLGVATFEVGQAYLRRQPLERLARPLVLRLVGSVRRTVHLGVLHGPETLYLLVERPPASTPLVTAVGVRLPAQLTASGRSLLAQLPEEQVRALFAEQMVRRGGRGPWTSTRCSPSSRRAAPAAGRTRTAWSPPAGAPSPPRPSTAPAALWRRSA